MLSPFLPPRPFEEMMLRVALELDLSATVRAPNGDSVLYPDVIDGPSPLGPEKSEVGPIINIDSSFHSLAAHNPDGTDPSAFLISVTRTCQSPTWPCERPTRLIILEHADPSRHTASRNHTIHAGKITAPRRQMIEA